MGDVVAASDVADGLAGIAPGESLPRLMRRKLRPAAELDAPRLGSRAALSGTGADQFALELGEPAKHHEH